MKKFIIITTINSKTKSIKKFSRLLPEWEIVLVGDLKSKNIKSEGNVTFLSVSEQKRMDFEIIKYLPFNHYSRKNIGYLYAIKNGADVIYDTDDDNIPYDNWKFPEFKSDRIVEAGGKFVNIYKYFTNKNIWPRGYPITRINESGGVNVKNGNTVSVGVWQGLADEDPDVDALYRLIIGKKLNFNRKKEITLGKNMYCPFNSQNTIWKKDAFVYLYLPSTVSFRFTDILRGYISQRLLWEVGLRLGFTKATVYQERNKHNLVKDFDDEITMYRSVNILVDILDKISLKKGVEYSEKNLVFVYEDLLKNRLVQTNELEIIKAWNRDLKRILK